MTSHLDEGRLQELVDGEIPSSELAPIQAHLAQCAACRIQLEEARGFAEEAQLLVETIELTERPVSGPHRITRQRPNSLLRNLAWAATIVVAAGTGYLARGSAPAGMPLEPQSSVPRPAAPVATLQSETTSAEVDQLADAPEEAKLSVAPRRRQKQPAKTAATDSEAGKARPDLERIAERRNEAVAAAAPPPITRGAAPARPLAQGGLASGSSANRLDEGIVVGMSRQPVEITFPDAVERLAGAIRLIEGLVPLRLEALNGRVRVIYPLATGELVLSQWHEDGRLVYRLTAPDGFPADSLDRLRARVRD